MSPENKHIPLRRILVPLDASAHSRAALEAAAKLAASMGAELSGLYVEDAELLDLCRYPFAREVGLMPARTRQLESADLERDFRIQAEQIRRMLAMLADASDINWSLTVRRGRVLAEILDQAASADLTVLGRVGRKLSSASMGSTVRHLIEQSRGMTLILQAGFQLVSPVLTVYDGSEQSLRAVSIAISLARAAGGNMEILIPAQTEEEFSRLRDELLTAAEISPQTQGMKLRFRRIRTEVAPALVTVLRAEYRQPVVLPVDTIDGEAAAIQRLINRIDNPVLLVR
ncbi:MAG: universal stress protein [Desulfobacterales bacterium]